MNNVKFLKKCTCGVDLNTGNTRYDGESEFAQKKILVFFTCHSCHSTMVLRKEGYFEKTQEKKGGVMTKAVMIFMMLFAFPIFSDAFEAEDQPVTQAQFEANQTKEKKSKHFAIPSAGELYSQGKVGSTYSIMTLGGGIVGWKCVAKPVRKCSMLYISRQTGFSNNEGAGTYFLECYSKETCNPLQASMGNEDSAVDAVVKFTEKTEVTDNNGNVKKLPVIVVEKIE